VINVQQTSKEQSYYERSEITLRMFYV